MPGTEGNINQLWANWSQSGTIISPFVTLIINNLQEVAIPWEYPELTQVLQFGLIIIFVAACPLAPLFAPLSSWVICLDAHRCICDYWWPVAEWAWGTGIWFSILEEQLLSKLNFTSVQAPRDFVLQSHTQCGRSRSCRGCLLLP